MAEQQDHSTHFSNNVRKAAGTGVHAVKAAAKAGAGDVAGAVVEVVKDENMRKVILAIILIPILMITAICMMVGAAITGTIETVANGFSKSWDEQWENEAINSDGYALYAYTADVGDILANSIVDGITALFVTESQFDNKELAAGTYNLTAVKDEDYKTTLRSVKEMESLTGTSGALQQRLDMIKGRVKQRGEQLMEYATTQYELEGIALSIAKSLEESFANPSLYYGLDAENSKVFIDDSAFNLSDIQALKILAAYSIQHDCVLSESDMWDLMDYCGWYGTGLDRLANPQALSEDSIYDAHGGGSFGQEIGGVVEAKDTLTDVYTLKPPLVPYWDGSFAPQWYYEQLAQMQANNDLYDRYAATGNTERLEGMIRYAEDDEGNIILDNFSNISSYDTYGLIDKMFLASTATLSVSRTEYVEARSVVEQVQSSNYLGDFFLDLWNEAFASKTKYTSHGYVYRNGEGKHSYTLQSGRKGTYFVSRTGSSLSEKECAADGSSVTFTGLSPNTTYTVSRRYNKVIASATAPAGFIVVPTTETVETFKTFEGLESKTAYKLRLSLRICYASRGVETLVNEAMGLWEGDLSNTEVGADGLVYCAGHTGDPNMLLSWTDTYTDEHGECHTITFERQQGYQQEAYRDYIMAIASELGYSVAGLYEPDYGYGDTIVSVALQEVAYYQENNLQGGMRYWDMAKEAIGWNFGYDAGWCACFVMCCAYQCGYMGAGQPFGDIGTEWSFSPSGVREDLIKIAGATDHVGWQHRDYMPKPGDLMFLDEDMQGGWPIQHIEIVKCVDPDGTLHTISGNPVVKEKSYPDYHIGHTIGRRADGETVRIIGYVSPNYPPAYNTDPAYTHVSYGITSNASCRIVSIDGNSYYLAGLPRFRESQFQQVVDMLRDRFPALYSEDLQTALDNNNLAAFCTVWNLLSSFRDAEEFEAAQLSIAASLFVRPVVETIMQQTGFDWSATPMREEVLLGVVSTSDNRQALVTVLSAASSFLTNDIDDAAFLAAMQDGNNLYNLVYAHKDSLWQGETVNAQQQWATGIYKLLDWLELNQPAAKIPAATT